MRLLEKSLVPWGAGSVKMVAEEPDDLWRAYNIIAVGDKVLADTGRKVVDHRDAHDTRKSKSDVRNVRLHLEVKVETTDYYDGAVRLHGKNVLQNGHVGVGQYHTLELQLMRPFELTKKRWDAAALSLLSQACERSRRPDQVGGKVADVEEEKKKKKKKKGKGNRQKGEEVEEREEKAVERFERLQRSQPDRACYGVADVGLAAELKAIDTLLVAERLFRSADAGTRRTYEGMADAVRASKGSVCVLPAAPGARVDGGIDWYTGVAAVLRFPLPEIECSG